jgi:phage shock protein A
MIRRANTYAGLCVLRLLPDVGQEESLRRFAAAYGELADWLDLSIPKDHSADLVALHRAWYEAARSKGGLASQTTTLALRDWAARRRGEATPGVPFDHKLYATRGVDQVSLTTLEGRLLLRCFVAGYLTDNHGSAAARLVETLSGWELQIAMDETVVQSQGKDQTMSTESVVTRIGRVMAGMAHTVADLAEQANPEGVLEQALREIDGAIDDVRTEIGKARSEQIRIEARIKGLDDERTKIETQIKTALDQNRDDLAETGIARQLDIESQANLLARLRSDAVAQLQDLESSLEAARASRRETEAKLADFVRSRQTTGDGDEGHGSGSKTDKARAKIDRAAGAAARITGVPSGPAADDPSGLKDLESLHRQYQIKERLAQMKAKR